MEVTHWFLSASLLCYLCLCGARGETQGGMKLMKGKQITQEIILRPIAPNEIPSIVKEANISSVIDRGNFSDMDSDSVNMRSNSSTQNDGPPKTRVSLPPLDCETDDDCREYNDPFLECRGGQCTCEAPLCWVYYLEVLSAFSAQNVFSCGHCGVLGSWCNDTYLCDYPGKCFDDGFCHCPQGENKDNVCMTTDTSWTYKMMGIGMGVVLLFGFLLIICNCYREQPWRHPQSCMYSCCKRGVRKNIRRGSCEKTPAYTIQNHYASQNSLQNSTPEGQLESQPSPASGAVPRRALRERSHRPSEESSGDEVTTSISSVATTDTIVSDSDPLAVDLNSVTSFPDTLRMDVVTEGAEGVANPVVNKQNSPQTVPNPVINERTVPNPVRDERTVPSLVTNERNVPNPVFNERTVPNPVYNERTVPNSVFNERTVPNPVTNERTVPNSVCNKQTVPICNERTVPNPVYNERTVPNLVSIEQTIPKTISECTGSLTGSNCDHERCTLCLPKGPSTRPATRGSSDSIASSRQSPYFSHINQQENEIEFTTL